MPDRRTRVRRRLSVFGYYVLVMAAAIAFFLYVRYEGEKLTPLHLNGLKLEGVAHEQINTLLHVLLALATVIITARAVGALFHYIHQPPVIGEVIGGILLGPSLLGQFAPSVKAYLLPATAAPFLGIIAQLGVIIYMFLVGLELDLKILRKSGHATLAISHSSILFPFILGAFYALHSYSRLAPPGVTFTTFSLFLGVSMSVTAFPVLARILTDKKIHKTPMGALALTCAAVDDATAWILLAFVVSIAQSKIGGAFFTLALTIGFILAMFYVGRPLIAKVVPFLETFERLTEGGMALIFVAILLSALATEFIGIHAIFGAFLLGAVSPHNSRIATELTERLQDMVRVMFLPAFFAFTGLRTQIGLLDTQSDWIECGWIICIATLGKFGGTFVASRFSGIGWRDSASLGVLMNTRGLVELIVLNIGLDLKIITPQLFARLVIMALVTTFLTTPLLSALTRNHTWVEE